MPYDVNIQEEIKDIHAQWASSKANSNWGGRRTVDTIGAGKYAGKITQLPTKDSRELNWKECRYSSDEIGLPRYRSGWNTPSAKQLKTMELLGNNGPSGSVQIQEASAYWMLRHADKVIAAMPEIKRNGNTVTLNQVIVIADRGDVGQLLSDLNCPYDEEQAKSYRIVSRHKTDSARIEVASYDFDTQTPYFAKPMPVNAVADMFQLSIMGTTYGTREIRRLFSYQNRTAMGFFTSVSRLRIKDEAGDEYTHMGVKTYTSNDGSSEYRKTNARPLVVDYEGVIHKEWMAWVDIDMNAHWYSIPPSQGQNDDGTLNDGKLWSPFRLTNDQFFSALKVGPIENTIGMKPMLILPGMAPKAVADNAEIRHFKDHDYNGVSGVMKYFRNIVKRVTYELNETGGDREALIKKAGYHMPMGIFDYSVSARKPIAIMKAPYDVATEYIQRVLPQLIVEGGKGVRMERLISNMQNSEQGQAIDTWHPLEKKTTSQIMNYKVKTVLDRIELPITRENKFW